MTFCLSNITESGNYTVLCGFPEGKYPDYVYAVVAGSDMMPGVADKKTIQIYFRSIAVPVPEDFPDCDMPQIIPTINIVANDTYYVSGSGDVVEIVFKTNIANNDFWVEIPGLVERTNLTSDGNFKATFCLSNITKSGNYTILCGFPEGKYPDYVYAVVAGSDMMPGVADKKTIQIKYVPTKKTDSIKSRKLSTKFVAKNSVFGQKTKVKRYSVILKDSKNKSLKNNWIYLKVKGKLFKAKTNAEGKARFKITNLNNKGKFTAKTIFNGNKFYSASSAIVKITVK